MRRLDATCPSLTYLDLRDPLDEGVCNYFLATAGIDLTTAWRLAGRATWLDELRLGELTSLHRSLSVLDLSSTFITDSDGVRPCLLENLVQLGSFVNLRVLDLSGNGLLFCFTADGATGDSGLCP